VYHGAAIIAFVGMVADYTYNADSVNRYCISSNTPQFCMLNAGKTNAAFAEMPMLDLRVPTAKQA